MKKIVLLLIILLALGGGAGGYFYFSKKAEASAGAEVEAVHEEAKGAHDGEHGEGAKQVFQYIEMDPLLLPIVDKNGVSQVVSLVVALEVYDLAAIERVKEMTPKLKDAFIQDMYGILNKYAALENGVVQVSMIKKRLNAVTQRVMGEGLVNDVLLQVVQQRPV
ncbi:MAG: flagellar basal body-associated FliL family protein [Alphaproteobacteria bacterium]